MSINNRRMYDIVLVLVTISGILTKAYFTTATNQLVSTMAYVRLFFALLIVLLSIGSILESKYNIAVFIFIIINVILMFHYESYSLLGITFMFFFIVPKFGLDRIMAIDFWTRLSMAMFLIFFSGILGSNDILDVRYGIRYSLGYITPQYLSDNLVILCFESLYVLKNKKYSVLLSMLFTIIIFNFSKSRTELIILLIFYPIVWFFSQKGEINLKRGIRLIICVLPLIFLIISYVIAKEFYHNSAIFILRDLDNLFSTRISQAGIYLKIYPIRLFGSGLTSVVAGENFGALDNGYINCLIRSGIIPTIIFIMLLSLTLWKISSKKCKYSKYLPFMLAFIVVGLIENSFYQIDTNVTLYIIGAIILKEARNVTNKKKLMCGEFIDGKNKAS